MKQHADLMSSSAYEVKNNCCLFERVFKVKKNGVFFLGISFFILKIFTFLYYANEESDDVIGGATKTVQHSIKNISGNIDAMFFKLGARNEHQKKKQNANHGTRCHDNRYAAGPVLIKTKISRFYLKQGSSTLNNLMGIV